MEEKKIDNSQDKRQETATEEQSPWANMQFTLAPSCTRGLCAKGVSRSDHQLNTYDWLADVPGNAESTDLVEVQFKNTRKGYYRNVNGLPLKKANLKSADDIKSLYRLAKDSDMERYYEAKAREEATMIQSRQIAKDLKLDMKIGDVEYQGDGNKAIFYYIADERVDFRQLIKVLADTFHVRIEMKQIGARQEAGRIGGTGPCGRELCCATWMKSFSSVGTTAARLQDISPNPQKLAGMCAKLKCCLNYEVDCYMDAAKDFPPNDAILQTADADYYHFKHDYLAGIVTYSMDKRKPVNLETITPARAKEVIAMNKEGKKPLSLQEDARPKQPERPKDMLDDSDLTRFDSQMKKKRKKKKKPNKQNKENKETKEEK